MSANSMFHRGVLAVCFLLLICGVVSAQSAARPDRGTMPNRTYAVSDIENISLQNGNVGLSIPLASLPPIAGGKLTWTVSAIYNSKLWNVTRSQKNDDPLTWAPYIVNTPQVVSNSWGISGEYTFRFRNANEDFARLQYPGNSGLSQSELDMLNNHQYYKVVLIMPDGSEHEFRRTDPNNSLYAGNEDFLRGYYNEIPTGSPMRYYSVDGSFLFATISSLTNWTVYMPDGTKVIQTPDGIEQIQDTNGNKIEIFSEDGTTHYRDAQTGREILVSAGSGGLATQVTYPTVTGIQEHITINWGQTTVHGKLWTTNVNGCDTTDQINNISMDVIREIVLPVTESGHEGKKFSFKYNSDAEYDTTATGVVNSNCPAQWTNAPPRVVSRGMGELSQITMPSGSVVDYSYSLDGIPDFQQYLIDAISDEKITQKQVTHDDNLIETWTYSISESSSAVSNPDGSGVGEQRHCSISGTSCNTALAGLVYRTTHPFTIIERHWTTLQFSGASIDKPGGIIVFNPVVDFEYTTLLDANNNPSKMSAKAFEYDYNGNITKETDYDWFALDLVQRDTHDGVPTSVPSGATVLRVINNNYYNQADGSSSGNVYAKRNLTNATPLILNALRQTTVGSQAATLSNVVLSYDGNDCDHNIAPAQGNLTEKCVYDNIEDKWIATSMTYDIYGNVVSTLDALHHETTLTYDPATHAQPISVTVDPQNTTGPQTSYTAYDAATGLVTSTTDVNGQVTNISYTNLLLGAIDPFGRPGVTTLPAVDGNGQHQTVSMSYYDSSRQVIAATDLFNYNDQLLKTRTTSDMLGRVILTEQTEDGSNYSIFSRKAFDDVNRITYASGPMRSIASMTDGWTRVTSDTLGRPTEVATFSGSAQPSASPVAQIPQWTGSVTTSYDANFTTVTDQATKVRRSKTDALGRLTRVDEPDTNGSLGNTTSPNQPTCYEYDPLGNLTKVRQGTQVDISTDQCALTGGQQRSFVYDTLSRLRSAVNPESGTITYTYEDNGNLKSKTDARSITTNYAYDSINRVISRIYDPNTTPAVTYTYDTITGGSNVKGRLTSIESDVAKTTYKRYDETGKALEITQTIKGQTNQDYTIDYAYGLAGHLTSISYPSHHVVNYNYDNAGRLADKDNNNLAFVGNLGDGGTNLRTYSRGIVYDAGGRMTKEEFGTAMPLYNKAFYNSRGQLGEIRVGTTYTDPSDSSWNRGAIINSYATTNCWGASCTNPNNNGNLMQQDIFVPLVDTPQPSGAGQNIVFTQKYQYDELNRLRSVTEDNPNGPANWRQTFAYDQFGNRTIDNRVLNGVYQTYGGVNNLDFEVETAKNRLYAPGDLAISDENQRRMQYDPAGNLSKDTYTGQGTRAYDGENRMTSAQGGPNAGLEYYSYDGDGHRVKRTVDGSETWQVYGAGGELLAEYAANTAASSPQKEYGYRNGQLLITAANATPTAPAPTSLSATSSSGNIMISWAGGALNYRVERKAAGGSFTSLGTTPQTSFTDSTAGDGSAYLYKVCAANQGGNCISDYTNIVLGAHFYFPTDSTICGSNDSPPCGDPTPIKHEHINELRNAINAVRLLAGDPAAWVNQTVSAGDVIYKDDVQSLRDKLDESLQHLGIQTSAYADSTLAGAPSGTPIKAVHIRQLRDRATSGSGNSTSGGSGAYFDLHWLVADQLGTPRMIFDQSGSLATTSRHDYLPFGEELLAVTSGRTRPRGYSASDGVKQHFTSKERDNETELDYFGARYYSGALGRFISVDPENFSLTDPQSMNKYRYALNNPFRYIDPNGGYEIDVHLWLTKALAYAAGFSMEQASRIASADQALDTPGSSTDPMPISHVDARALWHFTTTQRRAELWKTFSDDVTTGYFDASFGDLGRYLHTWQDHFSHGDRPPETGQLQDCFSGGMPSYEKCEAPDKTYEHADTADEMASTTFDKLMKAISIYRGTQRGGRFSAFTESVPYSAISDLVFQFNRERDRTTKSALIGQMIDTVTRERRRLRIEGIRRAYSLPSLNHDVAGEGMAVYLSGFEP